MGKGDKDSKKTEKTEKTDMSTDSNSAKPNNSMVIYRYNDIDFENATVPAQMQKGGKQDVAYINYNDQKLNAETKIFVQSGRIKITSGGIPREDPTYHPTDDTREYIDVPLDDGQESCRALRSHIENADEWGSSSGLKKKLFGKFAGDYQYMPCIKIAKPPKDDTKKYVNHDCVRFKFNMVGQGEERHNITKLIRVEGDKRTVVPAKTIKEITEEIKFQSEVKIIFYYAKIWANKSKAYGATKIVYGIGLKIIAIEYTPSSNRSLNLSKLEFLSDDDENGPTIQSKPSKNNNNNNQSKNQQMNSDEDSNNDSDKKPNKKPVKKVNDESDEDSDNKPNKKMDKKSKKPKDEDSEDSIPVNNKSNKKKSKKHDADSNSESEKAIDTKKKKNKSSRHNK